MSVIKIKKEREFKVVNKSVTVAEITLYADIGEDWWGDGSSVSARDFAKILKDIPESVNEIQLRINSPGGDVFDGITIYNRLVQHKAKVVVYVDGMAASIASIIALAGDEIIFGEGASMMIHKPWTRAMGNSNDILAVVDRLDEVEEQLVGIYVRKTGLDRTEIKELMAKETWFDAQQAIEAGFADKTMETEEAINIAASLERASWIRNKPVFNNFNDIIEKEINNCKNNIESFLARK